MKRWLVATLFLFTLTVLWQLLSLSGIWPSYFFPSPLEVGAFFVQSISDLTLPHAIWVTLSRLCLGYAIGLIIGIPMGLLNARYQIFEDTIGVVALGLQTLPSVCWVPLALLWFGQTETAMLFIVVMGSVWSIALATDTGVRNVPPIYIKAARTLGSRGLHTWLKVILPASFPFIVSGMRQGWAFAWRSLMAAEIYVTIISGFGLGHLLHYGRELHAMEIVIGVMLVIIAIGLMIDKLIFSPIESILHKRWGTKDSLRTFM